MVDPNSFSVENIESSSTPALENSRSDSPDRPFKSIQIRSLLNTGLSGLLVVGFFAALLVIPWSLLSLFGNPDSELGLFLSAEYTIPLLILHLWLYGVMAFWCFDKIRRSPLTLSSLCSHFPTKQSELRLLILVIPVLMFSLGIGQLYLLAIVKMWPVNFDLLLLSNPLLIVASNSLSPIYRVIPLLLVVVVEPALEELFFRGLILQRLVIKWNWKAGILISSLMFGILHANFIGFFVFGIVLALIYIKTRSLWLSGLLHLSYNAIALWAGKLSSTSLFPMPKQTLEQFSLSWRIGIIYASFAAPWLILYIYHHWPRGDRKIPYLTQ